MLVISSSLQEARWRLNGVTRQSPKFPLRLMPSVRRTAEVFSEKEGVSLNQFINVAVAEKLAHLEHEEWARNRKQPTNELAGKAGRGKSRTGKSRTDGTLLHAISSSMKTAPASV
jgi:hypothetical protein